MKQDMNYDEMGIRLNSRGGIDMDYYRNQAEALRAHHLAEMTAEAKRKIKNVITNFYQRYLCLNCQPSH